MPIKKIKLRSRPNPCVTDEIRSLIRTKDYWKKIARKSNDPLDWAAYKNFKREVKRELRLAEREHVENQIRNNPNNPRCVWKTIRSCIPRKSVKKKSFSDSDDAVAKEFNEFFNSIGQNSVEKTCWQINAATTSHNHLLCRGAISLHNNFHLDPSIVTKFKR